MNHPTIEIKILGNHSNKGIPLYNISLTNNHDDGLLINNYSKGINSTELIWTAKFKDKILVTVRHTFGNNPSESDVEINENLLKAEGYLLKENANVIAQKIVSFLDERLN